MKIRMLMMSAAMAAAATVATMAVPAVQAQNKLAPASAASSTPGPQTWTPEQLTTATVHQAWLMSGKNEATFFEMVSQLADMSAKNREVTLPQTEAAGRRFGELVKTYSKEDTDQLLYAVVDRAVRNVASVAKVPAGTRADSAKK